MKRAFVSPTEKKLQTLQTFNCQDCATLSNPTTISAVYNKFKQVFNNEPDLVNTPWNITQLDTILEERKKLTEKIKQSGYNGNLEGRSNKYISTLLNRYLDFVQLGFANLPWKESTLDEFENDYNQLLEDLLQTGFQSTKELKISEIKDVMRRYSELIDTVKIRGIWTLEDLNRTEATIKQPIARVQSNVFPLIDSEQDIKQLYTFIDNSLDTIVAGTLLILTFPFPPEADFSNVVKNINHLKWITFSTTQYLFNRHNMRFHIKLEINASVIDIEKGAITPSLFKFPQNSTWGIRLASSFKDLDKSLDGLIEGITKKPLDSTKKRLHKFDSFTLKLANRQFGGCKDYMNVDFVSTQCTINPGGKDDLCFWRCITIALYQNQIANIQKGGTKAQREKAMEL